MVKKIKIKKNKRKLKINRCLLVKLKEESGKTGVVPFTISVTLTNNTASR